MHIRLSRSRVRVAVLASTLTALTACSQQLPFTLTPEAATTAPSISSPTAEISPSPTAEPSTPTSSPEPSPTPSAPPIAHLKLGTALRIESITMLDSVGGWAVGAAEDASDGYQHILRTSDGGQTWEDVTPPEPVGEENRLLLGSYLNPQTAWVAYDPGTDSVLGAVLWRTTDGGDTWQPSEPIRLSAGYFISADAAFINLEVGWLLVQADSGMMHETVALLRTQDGGQTWEVLIDPLDEELSLVCPTKGITFVDEQTGWWMQDCGGTTEMFALRRTTNGGETWEGVPPPPPADQPSLFASPAERYCNASTPDFTTPSHAYLLVTCTPEEASWLYMSQDGGETWTSSRWAYRDSFPYYTSPSTGWALGRDLYQTVDGGRSWKKVKSVSWDGQFSFVDESHGWAAAQDPLDFDQVALVRTADGGRTWVQLDPRVAHPPPSVDWIDMVDRSHGWASGTTPDGIGRLLHTEDGGQTWRDVTPAEAEMLGQGMVLSILDADSAWFQWYESPALWRTRDGGNSWNQTSKDAQFAYIRFVDRHRGWAMDVQGPGAGSISVKLYRTDDGGASWRFVFDFDTLQVFPYFLCNGSLDLTFTDAQTGWLLNACYTGAGFSLLRTEDGGATWDRLDAPLPTDHPEEFSSKVGYCLASELVLVSPQSGAFVLDCDPAWPERQTFLYTTADGGESWSIQSLPYSQPPDPTSGFLARSLVSYVLNPDVAWAIVGNAFSTDTEEVIVKDLVLFRTLDGGKSWSPMGDLTAFGDAKRLDIDFVDPDTGWAFGTVDGSPALFITHNGGMTWEQVQPAILP